MAPPGKVRMLCLISLNRWVDCLLHDSDKQGLSKIEVFVGFPCRVCNTDCTLYTPNLVSTWGCQGAPIKPPNKIVIVQTEAWLDSKLSLCDFID